jgi:hypothetical protein
VVVASRKNTSERKQRRCSRAASKPSSLNSSSQKAPAKSHGKKAMVKSHLFFSSKKDLVTTSSAPPYSTGACTPRPPQHTHGRITAPHAPRERRRHPGVPRRVPITPVSSKLKTEHLSFVLVPCKKVAAARLPLPHHASPSPIREEASLSLAYDERRRRAAAHRAGQPEDPRRAEDAAGGGRGAGELRGGRRDPGHAPGATSQAFRPP